MLAARIAFRYLFSKKSTNAINIISWVSMLGMGFGAMALVCVLSVFNGFEGLVLSLYNSFYPDIEVRAAAGKTFTESQEHFKKMVAIPGVVSICKTLEENAYLEYGEEKQLGTIKGVDEQYVHVTSIEKYVRFGEYLLEKDSTPYAVIGANISFPMNIDVERGMEPLAVTVPRRGVKTAFVPEDMFNTLHLIPAGVFSIQQEFDSKYVLTSLNFARALTDNENELSAYEVKVDDPKNIERIKEQLQTALGNEFKVLGRYEQKAEMYRVMLIERWVTTAILAFIILIISFNIVGSLTMLVIEKSKDISIIQALGGNSSLIQKVYLYNGMFAALIGAGAGMLLGYLICFLQMKFHFIGLGGGSGSTFVIDYYPVELHVSDFFLTLSIIVLISLGAAYFPARKAAQSKMQFK